MSTPPTGQIEQSQSSTASKAVYANAFRAELRGDSRMAGSARTNDTRFEDTLRAAQTQKSAAAQAAGAAAEEENGFLIFIKTVIDIINPLQHLPVIGTIYRHMTGDELSPVARIAGGTLYGGPIGAAMGVVNAAVEETSGKDIGENMLAMVTGGDKKSAPSQTPAAAPTMLAAADIVWHTPARDIAQSGTALASADTDTRFNTETRAERNLQMAALSVTQFPSSDTPTTLRTQTGGKIEPDRGSLPSATPVLQTKEGMLAPTQAVNRTHTGLAEGAGRSSAPDVGERNRTIHPAKATPVLQSQNAPALAARRASTPEQFAISSAAAENSSAGRDTGVVSAAVDSRVIPQQMMAALDKYAALKKSQNAAMATGRLVPSYH